MSFTGTVEHGMVKLPPDVILPDGTEVRIEPLEKIEPSTKLHQQWIDEAFADGPAEPKTQADWDDLKKRVFACQNPAKEWEAVE